MLSAREYGVGGGVRNEMEFERRLDSFESGARRTVATATQFAHLNESEDQDTLRNIARAAKQVRVIWKRE